MKIYNIFYLISKICYTFLHRSAASDREGLRRWSARGPFRSRRHRSLEDRQRCVGWMRTHSRWSRSERIWESPRRSWTFVCHKLRSSFIRTSCKRQEFRPRKVAACPKKTRINLKKATVKPILRRINALRLPNGRCQKLQPSALPESSSACPSPTTCLTAVAATWTNPPDATSTSPMMSRSSITPSSSNLASLIYSTFILDHLKSNTNLELNLQENLCRKLFYTQLILFLDNAFFAQLHSYK